MPWLTFLQDLARLVPPLAPARRLTKVLIVNEATEYLRQQRHMCIAAAKDMQALHRDHQYLLSEVNTLRKQVMGLSAPLAQPMPTTEAMQQLADVEKQVLGDFPEGIGVYRSDESRRGRVIEEDTRRELSGQAPLVDNSFWSPSSQSPTSRHSQNNELVHAPEDLMFPIDAPDLLDTHHCYNKSSDSPNEATLFSNSEFTMPMASSPGYHTSTKMHHSILQDEEIFIQTMQAGLSLWTDTTMSNDIMSFPSFP